ncbi:MAG: CopG family transcriptional regulator [Chloroflexota bacterium]
MTPIETTTVQAQIPTRLFLEVEALVKAGWFRDINDLFLEALRRYLDSHRPELIERFAQEDVEWGLRGRD